VELVNAVLGGHAGLVQVPEDILCYLNHRRQALKGPGHETEFKYFLAPRGQLCCVTKLETSGSK
jgi:hypothetical protein